MKKIMFASAAVFAAATAMVNADVAPAFGGYYAGVDLGAVVAKDKLDSKVKADYKKAKASNTGLAYGLFAGWGKAFNNFYLGAEATVRADATNVKFTAVDTSVDSFKNKVSFGFAPVFGYVFGKSMVFAKTGFNYAKNSAKTTTPNTKVSVKNTFAFAPEFGYAYKVSQNVVARATYGYSSADVKVKRGNGTVFTKYGKATSHRIAVGAAYQF